MEDGKRIFRIILNILIPAGTIVLVCTLGPWLLRFFMPFVVGWCIALICNPLVKFLEKRLKLVRKHSSAVIRDSGSGRSDLAALFPGFQTDPGCHDVLPGAATAI